MYYQIELDKKNSKDPWIALFLNIAIPGLGYLYITRTIIGLVLFTSISMSLLLGINQIISERGNVIYGMVFSAVSLSIWIYTLVDVFFKTKKNNNIEFELERKNYRNPSISILLTIILPGLGHIYGKNYFLGLIFLIIFGTAFYFGNDSIPPYIFTLYRGIAAISAASMMRTGRKYDVKMAIIVVLILLILPKVRTTTYSEIVGKNMKFYIVKGDSMYPTINEGDGVLIDLSRWNNIKRGDIIAFKYDAFNLQSFWVKRVIGIPGDTVRFRNGYIYVNSKIFEYKQYEETDNESDKESTTTLISKDSIFVLGDNLKESIDSRKIGLISKFDIKGVVFKIVWPLSRISSLIES